MGFWFHGPVHESPAPGPLRALPSMGRALAGPARARRPRSAARCRRQATAGQPRESPARSRRLGLAPRAPPAGRGEGSATHRADASGRQRQLAKPASLGLLKVRATRMSAAGGRDALGPDLRSLGDSPSDDYRPTLRLGWTPWHRACHNESCVSYCTQHPLYSVLSQAGTPCSSLPGCRTCRAPTISLPSPRLPKMKTNTVTY